MNVRQLAELAGILSVHAIKITECPQLGDKAALARLAKISFQRSEAWAFRLEALSEKAQPWSSLYPTEHDPRSPLIEEILVAEILTRVIAGVMKAQGHRQGDKAIIQFATALFLEHQESRRLALLQMVNMADAEIPAVRKLDRLRRLAERWADRLLGSLACRFPLGDLLFDSTRAQDYGQAILPYLTTPAVSGLFAAGLRMAFPETLIGVPAHAGFHREMTSAILGLLPQELFEPDGGLLSVRAFRLMHAGKQSDGVFQKHRREAKRKRPAEPPMVSTPKLSISSLRRKHHKP